MIITETYERQKLYAFAASFLASAHANLVLDMACGDGGGSAILAEQLPAVVGVDIDSNLINAARQQFLRSQLTFEAGDARNTNFSNDQFDGIVSSHTLEHFNEENQHALLHELKRIVKPGGFIVISTPDRTVWELQGIAGLQKDHIREVTRREAELLFREAGLEIDRVFGQELLKPERLRLRRFLNFIKKMDFLKIRRLFPDRMIASVDEGTQPVNLTGDVQELRPGDLSSILIFVCKKK